MTIKFKKDKEYFIKTNNRTFKYRVIVSKVVTEMIEKVLTQVAIVVNTTDGDNSKTIKLSDITMVIEPVSNIEIFQMWTNWNNVNNPDCIAYDKAYANELRSKISKTLKERSYVMYGTGKLEAFDYKKMYEMRTDIKSENFKFVIGDEYLLQSGEIIKVLGRTDTKGYECLICSDGKYRYDRSTDLVDSPEKGRGTGTHYELIYPYNILNETYGNRYMIALEFCQKERVPLEDLYKIGMESEFHKLKLKFFDFLKSKNLSPVWSGL